MQRRAVTRGSASPIKKLWRSKNNFVAATKLLLLRHIFIHSVTKLLLLVTKLLLSDRDNNIWNLDLLKPKKFVLNGYVLSPEISVDASYFTIINMFLHPIAVSVVSVTLFALRIHVAFFAHIHVNAA